MLDARSGGNGRAEAADVTRWLEADEQRARERELAASTLQAERADALEETANDEQKALTALGLAPPSKAA